MYKVTYERVFRLDLFIDATDDESALQVACAIRGDYGIDEWEQGPTVLVRCEYEDEKDPVRGTCEDPATFEEPSD